LHGQPARAAHCSSPQGFSGQSRCLNLSRKDPKNIETDNPFRIAFHEWLAISRDLTRARSLGEAAWLVLGPPGWRADGQGATSRVVRAQWLAQSAGKAQADSASA